MVIKAYITKEEMSKINYLTLQLKELEKKQTILKANEGRNQKDYGRDQ